MPTVATAELHDQISAGIQTTLLRGLEIISYRNGDHPAGRAEIALREMDRGQRESLMRYITDGVIHKIRNAERKNSKTVISDADLTLTEEAQQALGAIMVATAYDRNAIINHALTFLWKAMQHHAEPDLEQVASNG